MYQILIVEDEKSHQRLIHDILRDAFDCVPHIAGDTTKAEAILGNAAIDLIILDYDLSGTTGLVWYYEFLQQHPGNIRTIPVLFVSVYAMVPEVKSLAQYSKVIVLPKPIVASDLIRGVRKLL